MKFQTAPEECWSGVVGDGELHRNSDKPRMLALKNAGRINREK
jgi:hypothetical protein